MSRILYLCSYVVYLGCSGNNTFIAIRDVSYKLKSASMKSFWRLPNLSPNSVQCVKMLFCFKRKETSQEIFSHLLDDADIVKLTENLEKMY